MSFTVAVRENKISLVCQVENTLAILGRKEAKTSPGPLRILADLLSSHRDDLFLASERFLLSDDLPPMFGKAFGDARQLSDIILTEINGNQHLGVCVRLLPSALKRLGCPDRNPYLLLSILRVKLFDYESKIALALVELTVPEANQFSAFTITADLIQEAIFALTHSTKDDDTVYQGRLYWRGEVEQSLMGDKSEIRKSNGFSLKALIEKLTARCVLSNRFVHFSAVGLGDACTVKCRASFANKLAQRSSIDYVGRESTSFYTYENVIFAASVGGIAVVLDQSSCGSRFTREFVSHQWLRVYEPMILFNLHCYFWVLSMCNREANVPTRLIEREFLALDELLKDAFFYRLRYRFSSVGFVIPHRTFHERLRSALELPRLESELMSDVSETHRFLARRRQLAQSKRAEQMRKQWNWLSILLAICGATVVTYEVVHALTAIRFDHHLQMLAIKAVLNDEAAEKFDNLVRIKHKWEIAGFFLSILLGVVAGLAAKHLGANNMTHHQH